MNVIIGICTCRNPDGLRKALDALTTHQTLHAFHTIVLDNDPDEAGHDVVEGYRDRLSIEYQVERTPGIPFARNTLIAAAMQHSFDYFIMFDDDEQPLPGWLDAMVKAAEENGAAIVGGGVVPRFDVPPQPPVLADDFTKKRAASSGGKPMVVSTANILMSGRFLRAWDQPLFDKRFQFSGGSDEELLRRVFDRGHKHVFEKDALVIEDIPQNRCQMPWLLKRHYRAGNVLGRVKLFHNGYWRAAPKLFAHGVILFLRGVGKTLLSKEQSRERYLGLKDRERAKGILTALGGTVFEEYADPSYRAKANA